MGRFFFTFIFAVFLCFFSLASFAESIRDQAIDQSDRIQRQQTQEQRFQRLHRRNATHEILLQDDNESTVFQSDSTQKNCLLIKSIEFVGAQLISHTDLHEAISLWEGRCLGIAEINKVLKAVTKLYMKRGYIAVRAYLPEQDLSGGHLKIVVV
ncbi:POTRA domain-containing protein, partial [Bartonella sp. AU18XJBT]|uniref:POTRA domain-containing protein n=1 Tax=Bartonella sp. AU18XJBT TaxID=3019089 RepID=UPI00235E313C